jgi:hypothetical protein
MTDRQADTEAGEHERGQIDGEGKIRQWVVDRGEGGDREQRVERDCGEG